MRRSIMRSGSLDTGRYRPRRAVLRRVASAIVATTMWLGAARAHAAPEDDPYRAEVERAEAAVLAGDDETALAAYRSAYAKRPKDDEVARRDLLHAIGRAEARRHGTTGDVAALRRAEASLADAEGACGEDAVACAAIGADLQAVRRELGSEPEAASLSPAPVVAPVAPRPAMHATTAPPLPPDDVLDRQRRLKTADGVAITGAVFAGAGVVALLFLAAPAGIAAQVAEDRAADDPLLVSEQELLDRADRRRRFARISAIAGAGGLVFGGVMLGAGLGMRAKINKEAKATAMLLEGGGGVALVGRF
jgi:hypothetical protein